MFNRRLVCAAILAFSASLAAPVALAQSFPDKTITVVVPNPPGGVVDSSARLVADPLTKLFGQAVIIDNRAGASGNIAYQMVARAPKDGYTLLASYSAYHVGNPAMFPKLPWDPKDLVPVALIAAATNVITAHPSVPAKNLKEFIAYVKQNPGKVNYASQGNGSLSHVGTELFDQTTQTEMTHVPYKGSGPAIQDVLSGQVQVFITTPPSVMGHEQAGKLKASRSPARRATRCCPTCPRQQRPGCRASSWRPGSACSRRPGRRPR